MKKFSVAILGASNNPERFSNKAFLLLKKNDYEVIPVSPKIQTIQDVPVFSDLELIKVPVDTLTVYVNAEISKTLLPKIINLKPRRIIFNPGTENPEIEKKLTDAGIKVINTCTLVLLNAGKFQD